MFEAYSGAKIILREEHTLEMMQEEAVRTAGPTRDNAVAEWRKLHNKQFNKLQYSHSIKKRYDGRTRTSSTYPGNEDKAVYSSSMMKSLSVLQS